MPVETTVLLIEAGSLPSALEEQLTKRGVFTEHATPTEIGQVLPVVVPDLVIQSGNGNVKATIAQLRAAGSKVPLIVIADRGAIRRLRDEQHGDIQALIPQDLPIAAVAHRLSTMAKRSAEGRPVDQPASQAAQLPERSRPQVKPPSEAPSSSKRGSLAPAPLAPHQNVHIIDADEQAQKEQARQRDAENVRLARERRKAEEDQKRLEEEKKRAERERRRVEEERQKAEAERRRVEAERKRAEEERRAAEALRRAKLEEAKSLRPPTTPSRSQDLKYTAEARRKEREDAQRAREERLEQARRQREEEKLQRERAKQQRKQDEAKQRAEEEKEDRALSALFPSEPNTKPFAGAAVPAAEQKKIEDEQTLKQAGTLRGRRGKPGVFTNTIVGIPAPANPVESMPKVASVRPQPKWEPPPEPTPAPEEEVREAPPPFKRNDAFARTALAPQSARESARPPASAQKSVPPPSVPQQAQSQKPTKSDDFSAVRKTDELSAIMPLPVEMRVPLTSATQTLPPIRLALLDTDLTRADALTAALRGRGMKIHPVTPDPNGTRWPLLRRFSPQGLVVDEKSMARGAAEWVERFRGDPFLRHVPVILVRFSRLFHENGSDITLEPLLHLVEHLGREEFSLLEKLGPGRQVDLWLSQLAPFRLVQMLTQEDRNTRLDCRSDTERLVWHLGPGYAGKAKLLDLGNDRAKEKLSPEDSLSWLLNHEDLQVSIHEHTEPLAHASESKDSELLLHEMTEALAAPERHQSLRPPSAFAERPVEAAPAVARAAPAVPAAALPSFSEDDSHPALTAPTGTRSPPKSPSARIDFGALATKMKEKAGSLAVLTREGAKRGWSAYSAGVDRAMVPAKQKLPPALIHWAPVILAAIVCVALLVIVLPGDDAAQADKEQKAKAALAAKKEEEQAKGKAQADKNAGDALAAKRAAEEKAEEARKEEEGPQGDALWTVLPVKALPSCEQLLGGAAPKAESVERSMGYWKTARRMLMVGKTEEAVESMCLAGLYDPTGPAAEGLAEYYLGQRSLKEAERWIRLSLKADRNRRTSRELLGDIENQKGNVEESKKILLDTLLLSGDETQKMQMTARKLAQDAQLARRGGDLPRAEREQRRAALLAPDNAVIATDLGEILFRREAYDAALGWALQGLRLDPNYSVAMLLAGRIQEARGDRKKAKHYFEMVPSGDPFHKQAQHLISRL